MNNRHTSHLLRMKIALLIIFVWKLMHSSCKYQMHQLPTGVEKKVKFTHNFTITHNPCVCMYWIHVITSHNKTASHCDMLSSHIHIASSYQVQQCPEKLWVVRKSSQNATAFLLDSEACPLAAKLKWWPEASAWRGGGNETLHFMPLF